MDFRQHDDTVIELRLTDRRGHPVRAAVCENLKIRVWTQDPNRYIALYPRDIRSDRDRDFLVIPDFEMAVLQPGVIIYRFSFTEMYHDDFGHGHHHHHEPGMRGPETSGTVVTDQRWRGMQHRDPLPSNPVNAHTLEKLREMVEDVQRDLSRRLRDLKRYVEEEYTDNLGDEIIRAKEAEKDLDSKIASVAALLQEEISRSEKADVAFLSEVNEIKENLKALEEALGEAGESASKGLEDVQKKTEESLEELEERINKQLKKLKALIEDELADRGTRDALLQSNIDAEISRAKGEENRLDTRIDNLKKMVKDNTSAIESETARAKLVEKDITESLQRLKQNVSDNKDASENAHTVLRNELIEKIEYKIKELIGAAPEALDTLEEIAERLNSDKDALKALNSLLNEKANSDEVYKSVKVDELFQEIRNLISAETQRAKLAEKANADAIGVINGDENTIGSIKHMAEDLKHYADDVVHALDDRIQPVSVTTIQGWFRKV